VGEVLDRPPPHSLQFDAWRPKQQFLKRAAADYVPWLVTVGMVAAVCGVMRVSFSSCVVATAFRHQLIIISYTDCATELRSVTYRSAGRTTSRGCLDANLPC